MMSNQKRIKLYTNCFIDCMKVHTITQYVVGVKNVLYITWVLILEWESIGYLVLVFKA